MFKIWYCVIRDNLRHGYSDARGEEAFALCYATSTDGLHWDKPILNLVEEDGSTANNLVWPFYRWGGGHGVFKDAVDPDPERRYKMLFTLSTVEMSAAGITQPLCAAFSADGVVWNAVKGWVNPVIPTGTDTQAAGAYRQCSPTLNINFHLTAAFYPLQSFTTRRAGSMWSTCEGAPMSGSLRLRRAPIFCPGQSAQWWCSQMQSIRRRTASSTACRAWLTAATGSGSYRSTTHCMKTGLLRSATTDPTVGFFFFLRSIVETMMVDDIVVSLAHAMLRSYKPSFLLLAVPLLRFSHIYRHAA